MYRILIFVFTVFSISACDSEQSAQTGKASPASTIEKPEMETVDKAPAAAEVKPEVKAAPKVVIDKKALSMSGEQVYQKSCLACHASGAAGAPKLGDVAAWKPRVSKGKDALYASAFKGVPGTAMMARGTCASCSDKELKAAVDFMLSKAK